MNDLRGFRKMARRPRPGRQRRGRPVIDSVMRQGDSLLVTPELKAEIMGLSRAHDISISAVVRAFLAAHEGRMDVEFERHQKMAAERAERVAGRSS